MIATGFRPGDVFRGSVRNGKDVSALVLDTATKNATDVTSAITLTVDTTLPADVVHYHFTIPSGYAAGDLLDVGGTATDADGDFPVPLFSGQLIQWGPTALPNAAARASTGLPAVADIQNYSVLGPLGAANADGTTSMIVFDLATPLVGATSGRWLICVSTGEISRITSIDQNIGTNNWQYHVSPTFTSFTSPAGLKFAALNLSMPIVDASGNARAVDSSGNAVGTSANQTTLLTRIGGNITISGGKVAATVASGDGIDAAANKTTLGTAGDGLTAVKLAGTQTFSNTGTWTGNLSGSVGSVTGGVTLAATQGSYAPAKAGDAMTLTSAYDAAKTAAQVGDAMALTSAERTTLTGSIWGALTSGLTTAGSIGKRLVDFVTTLVYAAPPTVGAIADAVWDEVQSGHTTAGTFGLYLDSTVSGVSSGGVSASDIATSVWAAAGRTLSSFAFNVTLAASQPNYAPLTAGAYTAPDNTSIGAIKTQTDKLVFTVAGKLDANAILWGGAALPTIGTSTLDAIGVRTALGMAEANLDTQLGGISGVTAKLLTGIQETSSGSGVYQFTASALENGPSGSATVSEDDISAIASASAAAIAGTIDPQIYAPATGSTLDLFRGDSYQTADGRGITITKVSSEAFWPTTLSTVHFTCKPTAATLVDSPTAASLSNVACTVVTATGSAQAFTLELTGTQMATLQAGLTRTGGYSFWFIANKDNGPATLRAGSMTVRADPSA